jgi:sugar lactone lactonase YvrE
MALQRWLRLAALGAGAALAMVVAADAASPRDPLLVFLNGTRVLQTDADGKSLKVVAQGPQAPPGAPRGQGGGPAGLYDGVAYDPRTRQIYWTDMGRANADDGTVQRVGLSGGEPIMVVPPGGAFTPKQLKIDGGKLYWADREGMRIMRANLDGSNIEVLVQTGAGEADRKDQARWCVGIAIDPVRRQVYWTQKGGDNAGQGTIKRASLDLPRGQTPANRTDVEVLFSNLPEPIDLDLDLKRRHLYWTDRGDNTVSRAPMDPRKGFDPAHRNDRVILVRGLKEAIGIALDFPHGRMFYTSLGGELGTARLDGKDARLLLTDQRTLTGITLVEP